MIVAWAVYFSLICIFLSFLIWASTKFLTYKLTEPIIKLNDRIKLSIESLESIKDNKISSKSEKKIKMSVEGYAKGYK